MSDNHNNHITIYKWVFFGLLILTALTVYVTYIDFRYEWLAILVGLLIATVKGFLVAYNFMHLNHESKIVYGSLLLTVFFFAVLMAIPILWEKDGMYTGPVFNTKIEEHSHSHNHEDKHDNNDEDDWEDEDWD